MSSVHERHPDRERALNISVTFNQIRNAVGILTEMMEETYGKKDGANERDIINKLRQMCRKIAVTYASYWQPAPQGIGEMLIGIYKSVLGSSVAIEEPADKQTVRRDHKGQKVFDVIDDKCPLCKAKRATNIGGCEVVVGLVEGLFAKMHEMHPGQDIPLLKADEVMETKTRGDERCRHRYVLDRAVDGMFKMR